ncbi:hypothetical protein Tco_1079858 [Tanacetum coccineum]|uniref:Uncharacterized protein n=1 Tax=Tanacetum coccineum TaxID=301880 RepID=A0ABQ5HV19_9ASTR
MDNKLGEAIHKAIQSHNAECREEAQAEKQEYIDLVDLSQNVTESLEAGVLARSFSQPKSTYEAAASLSEYELTKILLDKMEESKSHLRADYKRKLYDALVESYNTDKDLFETYGEVYTLKRSRYEKDKDQDLSVGSDRGTKKRKSSIFSKDTSHSHHKSSGKSAHVEEPSHTVDNFGVQKNQEFHTGNNDEQPNDEVAPKNNYVTARAKKPPTSFDELMDTPIDFSAFVMNRLNITNLTQELLVGPAFNLLKGTCKSLTELEYHFKECSKAKTERLDWHNPEGKTYMFDLRKPLPLIPDHRGRQVIPQDYFINNDLEYLKGGSLSRQYSTSVTKTKVATCEIKWIKDTVPNRDGKSTRNRWGKPRPEPVGSGSGWLEGFGCGDGTLDSVQTALHNITSGIRMEYLPKKKWSRLDKQRARVMIHNIDKLLFERRLMRNLEKFIGGREYGNDLRLLERTI